MTVTIVGMVATGTQSTRAESTKAVNGARQAATILYRADFKTQGVKGWTQHAQGNATPASWHINRKGILLFDGTARGQAEAQAPFSVAHLSNFAVQAQIETVGQPTDALSGFGIVVRNANKPSGFTTANTATGVMGGLYSSPNFGIPDPMLVWYPDQVAGAGAVLKSRYNTYRMEVHGATDYSLFINGRLIVRFPIALSTKGTHIGLWSLSQKLQVKSFRVLRLPGSAALPAVPPINGFALAPVDVPAGLLLAGRAHFTTLEEAARLDNVTTSVLVNAGFVLEYAAAYIAPMAPTTGVYEAYSAIIAFSSAATAHASWSADWAGTAASVQQGVPDATNYASGDVSRVGDEAHWFSYDTTETYYGTSFPITRLAVLFRRGPYEVIVDGQFVQGTVTHDEILKDVTSLAQTVDARSH